MIDLKGNREGRLVGLLGAILVFGTLACYWPVRHSQFINLDDPTYVYESAMVKHGFSWPGFVWAFKSFDGGNWNPLIWISHMADCQLFGLHPGWHHVTNVLLHAANAMLLFYVFRLMTGAIWRSALVAAIFAWHPMHVESVAWVAERKDVLSTLFWLLTMWAYAKYAWAAGLPRKCHYGLALFFFALGLMCKSMLVTLPLVLLLLDYWPLRRAEPIRKLLAEKAPFLALSVAACALAICAQAGAGAIGSAPMAVRLENAVVSYAIYLWKLFWPVDLACFYPFPKSISVAPVLAAALLLAAMTWLAIRAKKARPYLAVGWFWFLGTLVPVIGLVQIGMQAWADRYTYIPYIGLAMMASWGLGDLAEAWPRARTATICAAVLGLTAIWGATRRQIGYWENNSTLYNHALSVTSGNYIAHNNLGNMFLDENKLDDAAREYEETLKLTPRVAKPYNNLGNVYARQKKLDLAVPLFLKAVLLESNLAEAHYNLGNAYVTQGRTNDGIAELKKAILLKPGDVATQSKLVDALVQSGKADDAVAAAEDFVKADEADAHAHFLLGWSCQKAKQPDKALNNYKEALRLSPDTPECINAVAWVLATSPEPSLRDGHEAVQLASRACALTKNRNPALLDTLAAAYAEAGQFGDAIKTTEEIRKLAASTHDTNSEDTARQRLALYQAGKPCRDEQ